MDTVLFPLLMFASFLPLLGGADLVVRGASALALRLRIAPIVVGLTLVAFGTSLPELVINLSAALGGRPTIALGNVLGSNIFNVAATLGILAIYRSLPITRSTTWAEIPAAILAAVLMAVVAPDMVTRNEGLMLLAFFVVFLGYIGISMRRTGDRPQLPSAIIHRPVIAVMTIAAGLVLVGLGGEGVVRGAVGTARLLNIPEYIIAATIVAVGTSLPELVTSFVAVRRGEIDLAVGNVVGSNIFNVFLVLGMTATVRPIETVPRPVDHGIHILTTVLLFLFVFTGKGRRIDRWEGCVLVVVYLVYTWTLLVTA